MKLINTILFTLTHYFGPNSNSEFDAYLDKYNKSYNSSEYMYRLKIFNTNLDYITLSNENTTKTYKLGLNNFTDMTHIEFKKQYLNLNLLPLLNKSNYVYNNVSIPLNLDWRSSGLVTDVKNQGQCGSCWAFSAIGAIEGQHALTTGKLTSLSEQNLVDCAYNYSCDGCGGGWPDKAMQYVIDNNGVDSESSYPYIANDEKCMFNKSNVAANISKVVLLPSQNMTTLYNALGTVGPISVALDAEYDFQLYSSGIFESKECSKTMLDHAVLAIGYGISINHTKYLIIKNSWGVDWGMDGYIYFSTEIDNMCGISTHASYPL